MGGDHLLFTNYEWSYMVLYGLLEKFIHISFFLFCDNGFEGWLFKWIYFSKITMDFNELMHYSV